MLLTLVNITLNRYGVSDTKQMGYVISALSLVLTVKIFVRFYNILESDKIDKKE